MEESSLREIVWLQVSDIHMRLRDEWSQDVVLRAMADSIRQRRVRGLTLDFILVTGDLAFSGKKEEYALVERFFDELASAASIPKERIFCIPGNHDINRSRQRLCFQGARAALTSPNVVDPLLSSDSDDLATLKLRQEAYRDFQSSYFSAQDRTVTSDGLGYVSSLVIEHITLAIVGLDSAWLAEGGIADHGNLLVGERQVIDALNTAADLDPHIVIGMAHHPLHLLRDFDRIAATRQITERCHFYHCGHLHRPESYGAGFDASACLTVAAGASFETRESQNSYSLVKLDLFAGARTLTTIQYDPAHGAFEFSSEVPFPIRLSPAPMCTVGELAEAITTFDAMLAPHSHYLAALLLETKTEVPIPGQGGHAFGGLAVLKSLPEDDYCRKVQDFLRFGNVLSVLSGRRPLAELLAQHGNAVSAYGADLHSRCEFDVGLARRLAQQEADVRKLTSAQPKVSFTVDLFADLVQAQEWRILAEQARRHLENRDNATQVQARRMLAFALAHGTDVSDRNEAVLAYRSLIGDGLAEAQDCGNLATLLLDMDRPDEAKSVVLQSIAVSSGRDLERLTEIGQRIIGVTGDRAFRKQIEAAIVVGRRA
jgi:predicted MPP superfamily phosphohydrolase